MNRVLTSRIARLHFAATEWAAANLRREGVNPETIFVTGNTGIDAVKFVANKLEAGQLRKPDWGWLRPDKKLVLVTTHRRESFGAGFQKICAALSDLSARSDVQIAIPVHPNPAAGKPVRELLGGRENIVLLDPQPYVPFVDLMRRSYLILTDSGGIQEEAPSLGKPVLVLRDNTERPEAVEAGTVKPVGTDPVRIVREASVLLDDAEIHGRMSHVHNPYGDGESSPRIAGLIHSFFEGKIYTGDRKPAPA